jgi:hypothetical protein
VEELTLTLADLKDLRLDLRLLEEPAELSLVLGTDLRGSKSWLSGALTAAEARASVAPDSFWKLPLDAREATYQARSNPESMQRAFELLERVAQTGLAQLGASPAVQRDWPHAMREALSVSGAAVTARGDTPARLLPASPDEREQVRADFGYLLVGIEDEGKRYMELLERTLKAYEDTALRKGLEQRYGLKTSKLPKVQSRKGPSRLPESHAYEVALPASAFAETFGQRSKDAPPLTGNVPFVILTCREGQRTWLALSSYAALAEERLTAVLAASGPEATLARRPGLERLRTEKANIGAFWTLNGLQRSLKRSDLKKAMNWMGASDVPIIARINGHAAGPNGEIDLRVPAQVFRDVAARGGAQAMKR